MSARLGPHARRRLTDVIVVTRTGERIHRSRLDSALHGTPCCIATDALLPATTEDTARLAPCLNCFPEARR
jgi:hypothetical protein